MNDNSDDYDFTPSASSNLRSLFENSSVSSDSSNLIYTAPKQPKPGVTSEVQHEEMKTETRVNCARVVQLWKLIDGKYEAVGKHGFAIIASSTQTSYTIILYKEKRNVIARAKIGNSFEISLRKDDFASFYDSMNENWLIKFNSHEDCLLVIEQIEKYGGKVAATKESTSVDNNRGDKEKSVEEVDNVARANILSRIAKMGQSILPNKNLDVGEIVETANMSASSHSNESYEKSEENECVTVAPASTFATTSVTLPTRSVQSVPNTFVLTQPMPYDPLNGFICENRAYNNEMRMSLSQISEKLNNVMKSVNSEKMNRDPDCDVLRSKVKVLELRNENLLKELEALQEENKKLKMQETLNKEKELELKLRQEQDAKLELEKKINLCKDELERFSQIIEKQKGEIRELQQKVASSDDSKWKDEIAALENVISDLGQKLSEYEKPQKDEDFYAKSERFSGMLKEEMNEMYSNIIVNFDDQQKSQINSIVAQNIKSTTLRILQNLQQLENN